MNRRRYARWLCSSMVNLSFETGSRCSSATGVVEDISQKGLCVLTDIELKFGATVIVSQGSEQFEAAVRHCTSEPAGDWRVGLEFADGYEWNERDSWTEHLLDPESIGARQH